MSVSLNSYCIVKQKNASQTKVEDFISLRRCKRLSGNALLCYRYFDHENNLKFAVLGDVVEKNGDYCLVDNIADCAAENLLFSESDWEFTPVNNQSFDILFEDTVNKIVFTYCLSDEERAVFRMEQMKFPTKNIDDFKKNKTVYVYEGFSRVPLSEINNDGLKQMARRERGLYAIIADSLDEKRYIFLSAHREDSFKKIKTKSGYLFGIGAMQWYTDGGQEPTYAGVQSNNGGIWITPDSIRAYIQKLPKEE